jgi:hypothetical protein
MDHHFLNFCFLRFNSLNFIAHFIILAAITTTAALVITILIVSITLARVITQLVLLYHIVLVFYQSSLDVHSKRNEKLI